jgi:hypothetical protein
MAAPPISTLPPRSPRDHASLPRALGLALFFAAFAVNILLWHGLRHEEAQWGNVPPVPSKYTASFSVLGENELSYRVIGIMLQNLGDVGGRATAFEKYDYNRLGEWFFLADTLDPKSNFVPLLAAYYFGATRVEKDLTPVIDYLAYLGRRPGGENWRWLAQAAFLARFQQHNMPRALELAEELSRLDVPDLPLWAKQMPTFVQLAMGDKEAAFEMAVRFLQDEGPHMQRAEVNFLTEFICTRTIERARTEKLALCSRFFRRQPKNAGQAGAQATDGEGAANGHENAHQ